MPREATMPPLSTAIRSHFDSSWKTHRGAFASRVTGDGRAWGVYLIRPDHSVEPVPLGTSGNADRVRYHASQLDAGIRRREREPRIVAHARRIWNGGIALWLASSVGQARGSVTGMRQSPDEIDSLGQLHAVLHALAILMHDTRDHPPVIRASWHRPDDFGLDFGTARVETPGFHAIEPLLDAGFAGSVTAIARPPFAVIDVHCWPGTQRTQSR